MLDISGTLFSLLATYYFINQQFRAWPLAIIACTINITLYYSQGIYAATGLETYYFFSSIYGWYTWKRFQKQSDDKVHGLNKQTASLLIIVLLISIPILIYVLEHYFQSSMVWLDGTATAISICAQWLLCRKIWQTWLLWLIADSLYAVLCFYQQLPFHGMLFSIYTVMAVTALYRWTRKPVQLSPTPI